MNQLENQDCLFFHDPHENTTICRAALNPPAISDPCSFLGLALRYRLGPTFRFLRLWSVRRRARHLFPGVKLLSRSFSNRIKLRQRWRWHQLDGGWRPQKDEALRGLDAGWHYRLALLTLSKPGIDHHLHI